MTLIITLFFFIIFHSHRCFQTYIYFLKINITVVTIVTIVTPNHQSIKAKTLAFWNEFITNYSFPEKLLMDQGHNFKSQLIKELCRVAHICKVKTTPYHPETNGLCERFNQMLISMIGTLESDDKQH